jgi:hypothetical protein
MKKSLIPDFFISFFPLFSTFTFLLAIIFIRILRLFRILGAVPSLNILNIVALLDNPFGQPMPRKNKNGDKVAEQVLPQRKRRHFQA